MAYTLDYADHFFSTARERYQINQRRLAGQPWPWTSDYNFRSWRFCQVHREDDKTTVWFRDNIRGPLSESAFLDKDNPVEFRRIKIKILEATLFFRWFNRIETGKCILDLLLDKWDTREARSRLDGISPIVTGAYIIKAGDGVSKLDGILDCIDEALPQLPRMVDSWAAKPILEEAWHDLKGLHFMGGFMSYEVVSDLRWTPLLFDAPDIMTWANAGPGCARGLGWVVNGDSGQFNCGPKSQRAMLELMRELLELSKDQMYWPQQWKRWEMREVEHWCCEYDKYKRSEAGEKLKRRYPIPG